MTGLSEIISTTLWELNTFYVFEKHAYINLILRIDKISWINTYSTSYSGFWFIRTYVVSLHNFSISG